MKHESCPNCGAEFCLFELMHPQECFECHWPNQDRTIPTVPPEDRTNFGKPDTYHIPREKVPGDVSTTELVEQLLDYMGAKAKPVTTPPWPENPAKMGAF
jgi:hypothetical protein